MEPLCESLLTKIHEQIDRTIHLIGMLRPEDLAWAPPVAGSWPTELLLGHLLDCLAGFCAVLVAANPERLAHFGAIRELRVNQACSVAEATQRISDYQVWIEEGFAILGDVDLGRRMPTVFVPEGETVLMLVLGNLEHVINHKYQLFMYLKLLGAGPGTPDLYTM